jgi:hypothetical protein
MTRARPNSRSKRAIPNAASDLDTLLEQLVRLLANGGRSPRALARRFRAVCSRFPEPSGEAPAADLDDLRLGHVITHWYHDPAYLNERAAPLPLPLRGHAPSLEALVTRVLPQADSAEVIAQLKRAGFIRQTGRRVLPTGRTLFWDRWDELGSYIAELSLRGYLSTHDHNLHVRRPEDRRFEMLVYNSGLPRRLVPALQQRFRRRYREFLNAFDAEMKDYESRAKPGDARTALGVTGCVFEFNSSPRGRARPAKR